MRRNFILPIIITMVLGLSMQAHADLNLLGQGTSTYGTYNLIYDTDLDITWYDYTSTDDLWQNQVNWVDALSVNAGGIIYDDWRLPITTQPDSSCSQQSDVGGGFPIQGASMNCTGCELGHLYYTELGNSAVYEPPWGGLQNTGVFQNLLADAYWSGTKYAPNPTIFAWHFNFDNGNQNTAGLLMYHNAIAVMDGMATVPIPSAVWLLGSGLIGIVGIRRKFKEVIK